MAGPLGRRWRRFTAVWWRCSWAFVVVVSGVVDEKELRMAARERSALAVVHDTLISCEPVPLGFSSFCRWRGLLWLGSVYSTDVRNVIMCYVWVLYSWEKIHERSLSANPTFDRTRVGAWPNLGCRAISHWRVSTSTVIRFVQLCAIEIRFL